MKSFIKKADNFFGLLAKWLVFTILVVIILVLAYKARCTMYADFYELKINCESSK